jgi:hypothetical protein
VKLIYVAGAYRADTPEKERSNILKAATYAALVWKRGHSAICPHANTYFCWKINPATHEQYIMGDLVQLARCDELHLLPGWEDSEGCKAELACATYNGLEVVYVSEDEFCFVANDDLYDELERNDLTFPPTCDSISKGEK